MQRLKYIDGNILFPLSRINTSYNEVEIKNFLYVTSVFVQHQSVTDSIVSDHYSCTKLNDFELFRIICLEAGGSKIIYLCLIGPVLVHF